MVQLTAPQPAKDAIDLSGDAVQSDRVRQIYVNSSQRADRGLRDLAWSCARTTRSARLNQFRLQSIKASLSRPRACCQRRTLRWYLLPVLRQDERETSLTVCLKKYPNPRHLQQDLTSDGEDTSMWSGPPPWPEPTRVHRRDNPTPAFAVRPPDHPCDFLPVQVIKEELKQP